MSQPLLPRRPGRATTRFSNRAVFVGGGALAALILGAMVLPTVWQRTPAVTAKEQPHEQLLTLPEVISRPLPPRVIVAAAPIVQDPAPMVQRSEPDTTPHPGKEGRHQSFLDTMNPFATKVEPPLKEKAASAQPPTSSAGPQQPTPPPQKEAKPRKGWAVLATPPKRDTAPGPAQTVALAGQEEMPTIQPAVAQGQKGATGAQDLIKPARWAIPAEPLKTLYASQVIAARTEIAINSSIPGRVILSTTIPTMDKFHQGVVILPKATILVAEQETQQVQFGETRIAVRLIQAELPSGEIVDLRATIGDANGAQGLTGKVNNSYGKILLAAGINALISLGGNSLAGTPSGFYANPIQQSVREVSQSVSQDARNIVQKQLQVSPVITIPAQTVVSIVLSENVQFNRPPVVAR